MLNLQSLSSSEVGAAVGCVGASFPLQQALLYALFTFKDYGLSNECPLIALVVAIFLTSIYEVLMYILGSGRAAASYVLFLRGFSIRFIANTVGLVNLLKFKLLGGFNWRLYFMYIVEIGQWECSDEENKESDFRYQCLLLFLYTVYSNFSLEKNSLETFVGPRDEQSVLRLALAQVKCKAKVCV